MRSKAVRERCKHLSEKEILNAAAIQRKIIQMMTAEAQERFWNFTRMILQPPMNAIRTPILVQSDWYYHIPERIRIKFSRIWSRAVNKL